MTINQYLYIRIKKWLFYSLLSLIILGIIFPNIVSSFDLYSFQSYDGYEYQNLVGDNKLELSINSNQEINPKIQAEDPEAYFPNFLLYSIETANALIDYLYDDESGGFYTSSDEYWNEQLINKEKRTYDNAQAILALLKLSDAVVNETERYFALDTAEKSAKYLITQLYNSETGGFYISTSSLYKKPGIQAKAIQALLSLYEITGNLTYKEIAINTFEFLEDFAWDNDIGAYYYLLSPSGTVASSNPDYLDPFEPYSKRVDHNILMANAVLDLYGIELNEKYLTRAIQIYNFFNSTCRNNVTGLFYTGLDSNNALVDPSYADVFINSLVLEFLSYLYDVTGNEVYKEDFFNLLFIVMKYYWDDLFGGYWATYSYNSLVEKDEKKYTERQFYVMRALDEAYAMTDNSLYYNLILDIVEILNNKLYDHNNAGYFQLTNNDGTPGNPFWNYKYTVTQSLAIYELSNLWLYSKPGVLNALWAPSTPRPQDSVTILVAAFDADGISNVFMNYSLNNGPYQLLEMVPQSNVGSMYNCTLESQYEGTTINFNIIVNDTLGNIIIRGSYFFLWQVDIWAPQILEIGFDPDFQIPIRSQFSITVSAVDIPSQGTVKYVRMYYHKQGGD